MTVPYADDCTAGRDRNPALSAAAIRIIQVIRALPGTSVRERTGERMQEGLQQKAFTYDGQGDPRFQPGRNCPHQAPYTFAPRELPYRQMSPKDKR